MPLGGGEVGGEFADVDLMGDDRWFVSGVQGVDTVADDAVGGGDAFAGAEVVEPGLHEKGLVEDLGVAGVAVDAPADGAVAEADAAELVDDVGELDVALEGDVVLDGDADGAFGEICFGAREGGDLRGGAGPLVGGEVGQGALQDVEAPDKRKRDEQA